MVTLSISQSWQDYIIAIMSAIVATLVYFSNAGATFETATIVGCLIVFLQAMIDVNKTPVATPPQA